jgi:hypothetical protein
MSWSSILIQPQKNPKKQKLKGSPLQSPPKAQQPYYKMLSSFACEPRNNLYLPICSEQYHHHRQQLQNQNHRHGNGHRARQYHQPHPAMHGFLPIDAHMHNQISNDPPNHRFKPCNFDIHWNTAKSASLYQCRKSRYDFQSTKNPMQESNNRQETRNERELEMRRHA